jgi:pilus assembly protein CpaC
MACAILPAARPLTSSEDRVMQRRLVKPLLAAACALLPLALSVPAAQAQTVVAPQQDLVLSIGRGQLINVPGQMTDIFVANEAVADVEIKSRGQLYLMGLAGGETTVYASDARGGIIWSANVRVGSNLDSVDQMLAMAMPDAKISVATMGASTVLLTGTVASPEDASEAERLTSAKRSRHSSATRPTSSPGCAWRRRCR